MRQADTILHHIPTWVPPSAQVYLAHTETGQSIRAIARKRGCHASTIMRQIRRVETQRDDPLVDSALKALGAQMAGSTSEAPQAAPERKSIPGPRSTPIPDEIELNSESIRVLRRMCETGAVLAVALEMEKAVVVRETPGGTTTRTAVVDRGVAQALALKGWIQASIAAKITRYQITPAGRTALADLLKEAPAAVDGFAESAASFQHADDTDWSTPEIEPEGARPLRQILAESPLCALARRRSKDGTPFLTPDLVSAGERLREDFELSQMGGRLTQDWDQFLVGGGPVSTASSGSGPTGPREARDRVALALTELGPGLSDIALRCCCYLEGLEAAERRLGWSARSAKIVLRIALHRLKRHYEETTAAGGGLIG